jgi:dTDP-4-amino-4,6-dideoxygalactose transaminase
MLPYADPAAELSATDQLAEANLALPMGPTVGPAEAEQVVAALEHAARVT